MGHASCLYLIGILNIVKQCTKKFFIICSKNFMQYHIIVSPSDKKDASSRKNLHRIYRYETTIRFLNLKELQRKKVYVVPSISFQTFFVPAFKIVVDT